MACKRLTLRLMGHAPAEPSRLKFGRAMRIKQGRDFFHRVPGRMVSGWFTGCLIANWRKLPAESMPRLGVITSGKIGNAVAKVRNRARRLLREAFRSHQHDLVQPVDLVLVARASIVGKGFAEVEKDFLTTLRRAKLLSE